MDRSAPDSPFARRMDGTGRPVGSGDRRSDPTGSTTRSTESVTVSAAGDVDAVHVRVPARTPRSWSRPKPYLHPLRTLGGDLVSLFRPHDHVWHKGIAWSLPHVGEHNFWGGPTYVHGQLYVQLDNNGSADHREMTALAVGGDASPSWRTGSTGSRRQGEPVIDEHRRADRAGVLDDDHAGCSSSTPR